MIQSACTLMKEAVVSSVVFMAAGGFLVFLAQLFSLQSVVPVVITYLGFFFILAGILVLLLLSTVLLLPKISSRLDLCQH